MKKVLAVAAAFAASAAFAALDFSAARSLLVLAPGTTVSSGATNTVAVAARGLKGNAALFVPSAAAPGRTSLDLSVWTTNTVSGGWSLFAARSVTATNAGVYRLSFPAEYLTRPAQVRVGSVGAASAVSAFILAH